MKLKLDENLSRHLKPNLTRFGHDVKTAADEKVLSQPDRMIGAAAQREGRMLLTLDLEFADLRKYPPGEHPGVFLFRPKTFGPLSVNRFVEQFVRDAELEMLSGCVVVVDPDRVRIRRPPLDTESGEWTEVPIG